MPVSSLGTEDSSVSFPAIHGLEKFEAKSSENNRRPDAGLEERRRILPQAMKIAQTTWNGIPLRGLEIRELKDTKILQMVKSCKEINLILRRLKNHPGMMPGKPGKIGVCLPGEHDLLGYLAVQVEKGILQRHYMLIEEGPFFGQIKCSHE